jgi:hypothetical protein
MQRNPKTILCLDGASFDQIKSAFSQEVLKNPVICPCCERRSQVWKKRPISSAIASLIKLVNLYDGEPIHLDRFNVAPSDRGNGNFSQLALWGLIERADNSDKKKRSSGMYAPTREGVDFVYCLISIPKHVYTLNDEVIETEGPQVYIKDVLGDKFDYQELMDMQY